MHMIIVLMFVEKADIGPGADVVDSNWLGKMDRSGLCHALWQQKPFEWHAAKCRM